MSEVMIQNERVPEPIEALRGVRAYSVNRHPAAVELDLDANERTVLPDGSLATFRAIEADTVRKYPEIRELESVIARRFGIAAERVLATAGGDEAIDRICRAYLGRGREIVLAVPTFEMIERYASMVGAGIAAVDWPSGAFPTAEVIAAMTENTGVVAMVSPNNPTGSVATVEDFQRVAEAAASVGALVMVDAAYAEFLGEGEDLTSQALERANCVVVRTLSKAYGCAGLRCGYVMGEAGVITTLRAAGNPFSVSGPTIAAAKRRLESGDDDVRAYCGRICDERTRLEGVLSELGCEVTESRANFVFCRTRRASWVRDALAGMGIAIRGWTGRPGFEDALRITLPGNDEKYARLESALRNAIRPEAILFDMDGVLARVDGSYRAAIVATAESYGVTITTEDIKRAKREGNANDDWELTHRFVREGGVNATLEEVTERFERLYQGEDGASGLKQTETLIPRAGLMEEIAKRVRMGVVTGRPRRDAQEFLERFALRGVFEVLVCMEDTERHKPDPEPVREAMSRLGIASAWYVGDTRDDMTAARAAGAVGVAHVAPQDDPEEVTPVLLRAGGGRVVTDLETLLEFLP